MASTATQPTAIPVGTIKSFGPYGPIYEVLGPAPQGKKGAMVFIRVIHGGEELAYPLADMLSDPLVP